MCKRAIATGAGEAPSLVGTWGDVKHTRRVRVSWAHAEQDSGVWGETWGVRQIAPELMWFASLEMKRTGLVRPLSATGKHRVFLF